MFRPAIRLFLISAGCVFVAAAQNENPVYVVDQCVKANPGKGAEIAAYLGEVSVKVDRVRVDEGRLAWWLALSAVSPAGSEARCDFHMVSAYNGFPPEPGGMTAAQSAAELKKAGITMSSEELAAKRNSMSHLVNTDMWRVRADAGPSTGKGQYVRVNYYKVKPGQGAEFIKLETTGWKPFAESLKDPQLGWHLNTLVMPTESYEHYNAMTADVYPTWEALSKGWPTGTEWSKVHPDLPFSYYITQVGNAAERYGADVFKVVEVVGGSPGKAK